MNSSLPLLTVNQKWYKKELRHYHKKKQQSHSFQLHTDPTLNIADSLVGGLASIMRTLNHRDTLGKWETAL